MSLIEREHFERRVRMAGGMAEEELTEDFKDGVLTVLELLKTEPTVSTQYWIPTEKQLPEMHDAGILKKIGIMQRSDICIITVRVEKEYAVDNDAELRDGKWHSDLLRFLDAGKKRYEVIAWMPLPESYMPE